MVVWKGLVSGISDAMLLDFDTFIVVEQSIWENRRRCCTRSVRYVGKPPSLPHLRVLAAPQIQNRHDLVNSLFALCLRHVRPIHLAREQQILANCRGQGHGRAGGLLQRPRGSVQERLMWSKMGVK